MSWSHKTGVTENSITGKSASVVGCVNNRYRGRSSVFNFMPKFFHEFVVFQLWPSCFPRLRGRVGQWQLFMLITFHVCYSHTGKTIVYMSVLEAVKFTEIKTSGSIY